MTNRGRKNKPCWYVEDFQGVEGSVGKCLFVDSRKFAAEGHLKWLREKEKSEVSK